MRTSAFDPPAIPADFWERPDVCQALAKRDMGALFRLLRQYTGLSQTRIATAIGIAQGRISEVITASASIGATHVFERIANGLDMPDPARVLLGPGSPAAPPAPPRSPARHDPARKPSCSGRSPRPAASTAQWSAPCKAKPTPSGCWTAASAPRPSRPSWKPTSARSRPACATRCAQATAQQLAAVLADASALAGWQAIDMGRLPRAWDHFERATAAAREAADPCLLAFAAGEQAYVLLDLHRPAEALDMVRAAYDETRAAIPHQIRGWLRAAEAEMAAAAGQESTCRHALDGAAREIGYGPSGDDLPYLALNETHLARWRGNCLVHFGDPQTADELATALDAMDGSFTRAEAGLRCDLAAALHVRGEHDEARRHLSKARELAQLTGSARQRRRIRDLTRRIGKAA